MSSSRVAVITYTLLHFRFSWVLLGIIIVAGFAATIGVIFTNTTDLFLYIEQTNACSFVKLTSLNTVIICIAYSLVIAMQGEVVLDNISLEKNCKVGVHGRLNCLHSTILVESFVSLKKLVDSDQQNVRKNKHGWFNVVIALLG